MATKVPLSHGLTPSNKEVALDRLLDVLAEEIVERYLAEVVLEETSHDDSRD